MNNFHTMKMKTKVQTKTKSVTTVQMAVATMALFLANGLAFMALPLGAEQQVELAQVRAGVNPARDCGLQTVNFGAQCGVNQYRNGTFVCKDGARFDMGGNAQTCYPVAEIERKGQAYCYNHCVDVRPRLTVSVDADTPLATNLLSGDVDQSVAKFKIANNSQEKVSLNDFVVSFHFPHGSTSSVRSVKLFDENGFQFGPVVGVVTSNTSTFAHASFDNLNLVLGLNKTRVFTVKVDLDENNTGRFQPVIVTGDYDGTRQGLQLPIRATGVTSGIRLEQRDITFQPRVGDIALGSLYEYGEGFAQGLNPVFFGNGNVEANQFVTYGSKLRISWSGDTPSGVSAPNAEQLIGKVQVTNVGGGESATLKVLNFQLNSLGFDGARTRELRVYRDSLNSPAIATTNVSLPPQNAIKSAFADRHFSDVLIEPGATKTFFVTLDTSGAGANDVLSVTLPGMTSPQFHIPSRSWFPPTYTYDYSLPIMWAVGDGFGEILAHDLVLPLVSKTFTY